MNSSNSPLAICAPQRFGATWATVTIDKIVDARVLLHVSIMLDATEEILGRDVQARLLAGEDRIALTLVEAPQADLPLMEASTRGRTAFARYAFDNPDRLALQEAVVTIGTETRSFDLTKLGLQP